MSEREVLEAIMRLAERLSEPARRAISVPAGRTLARLRPLEEEDET